MNDRPNSKPNGPARQADPSTRQKILRAARKAFADKGKAGARVDHIADQAGVNKAMIYYHFQSKDNLYMEVIRDFYSHIKTIAYGHLDQSVSFETTLTLLAENFARLFDRISEFKPIILRELANPNPVVLDEIAKIFHESGIIARLMARVVSAEEAGEIREIDIVQGIISFVTMNLGYVLMAPLMDRLANIHDSREFANERKRAVVDIFLYGLKPR